jgi:hypothetical protein
VIVMIITPPTPLRPWQWLQEDLESVDRSVTPWVLVLTHSPWSVKLSQPARSGLGTACLKWRDPGW